MTNWREVLGVHSDATYVEVRKAWRQATFAAHPDHGGSTEALDRVNAAMDQAVVALSKKEHSTSVSILKIRQDISSFTINMLPVDAWPSMVLMAVEMGQIIVDEEPYMIEFTLQDSGEAMWLQAWCRCDLVPEAGATMVHITVGTPTRTKFPNLENVRDVLVRALNDLQ